MLSNSSAIIVVSYAMGLRGQAVDRIINLSPDMAGKQLSHAMPSADGALHDHPGSFGNYPDGQPFRLHWDMAPHHHLPDCRQHLEHLLDQLLTSDGPSLAQALIKGKVSTTTHASAAVVRKLFPNAKIVIPSWYDQWHVAVRDISAKLWACDATTDNNIGKYCRWQAARQGLPDDASYVLIDMISRARRSDDLRGYTRELIAEIKTAQVPNHMDDGIMVLDLRSFFGDDPSAEYQRLCDFLCITAVPDQALDFLTVYSSRQWRR